MLVARFFAGIGGSTFSTMVGGIVADIFRAKDRNIPMALFSGSALFGTALGPLVSSFIAQYTTWRWIFYMQIAIGSVITIAVVLFFKETRGPTVLRNKADALNRWYLLLEGKGYHLLGGPGEGTGSSKTGSSQPPFVRIRWKGAADDNRATLVRMITTSVQRPFVMLLTEPVVFFFSLWAAFSWSVLYINLSVIPLVFENVYGFSLIASDAQFTAAAVGSVLAMFLSIFQDTLAERRDGWNTTPEHRLYFSCVESVLLPIGLFMFGWSSQYHVHWIVPSLAVGLSTMGIFSIYLAVFNYLADTYHRYASSALAAQSFCRNVLGGIFPLVSKQMFENLGFGAAASLLGGIATGLTFVPWVLVFLGPKIRAQSKLASELSK
jgi:MFS family permease